MHLRSIVALLNVVAVCFVTGLILRPGAGLRAKNVLDRYMSSAFPVTPCFAVSPGA